MASESELELARRAAADMLPRNPQNHYPIGRTALTFLVQWRYAPWSDRWETEDAYDTEDEAHRALTALRESDAQNQDRSCAYRIVARQETVVHTVSPE